MAYDERIDTMRVTSEKLAQSEYESNTELILKGFKIFQKNYVYGGVVFQLILVVLAILAQVLSIASSKSEDVTLSAALIIICIILGVYLFMRPHVTYKNLKTSLADMEGVVYGSEIYTDKIVISTLYDPYIEGEEKTEESEEEKEEKTEEEKEDDTPPATVIHTDNSTVEIVESSDLYVVYVKKINVFVIPKNSFSDGENEEIRKRLSNLMGARYKKYKI